MRCGLELRSPAKGTGWSEHWVFSGKDGRVLLDCLDELVLHAVEPPLEVWDFRTYGYKVRDADRWHAAMLQWPDEPWERGRISFEDRRAEAAWDVAGALRLGESLPERFGELRAAIRQRFATP